MDKYLLTSLIVFTLYIAYIMARYGVRKSISESFYRLKYKKIFPLIIWGFTIPIMLHTGTPIMFIACSLICFIGAAPAFKSDIIEHRVHMFGAFGGILTAFASLVFEFDMIWIFIIFVFATTFLFTMRFAIKYIWWIEVVAFYLIIIGLLIR